MISGESLYALQLFNRRCTCIFATIHINLRPNPLSTVISWSCSSRGPKISRQVVNALCPPGRSVMEVHYFINARASTPVLDPRLESEDDENDEEGERLLMKLFWISP